MNFILKLFIWLVQKLCLRIFRMMQTRFQGRALPRTETGIVQLRKASVSSLLYQHNINSIVEQSPTTSSEDLYKSGIKPGLLNIPLEVRFKIYSYLVPDTYTVDSILYPWADPDDNVSDQARYKHSLSIGRADGPNGFRLILVNRQIHKEFMNECLDTNSFAFPAILELAGNARFSYPELVFIRTPIIDDDYLPNTMTRVQFIDLKIYIPGYIRHEQTYFREMKDEMQVFAGECVPMNLKKLKIEILVDNEIEKWPNSELLRRSDRISRFSRDIMMMTKPDTMFQIEIETRYVKFERPGTWGMRSVYDEGY